MPRAKILQAAGVIAPTFFSEPPYIFAAARQGVVEVKAKNWASINNQLTARVQWGTKDLGVIPKTANYTFVTDPNLNVTISGGLGTASGIVGYIKIPQMVNKAFRLFFEQSGPSSRLVDVEAYFNWQK